MRWLQVDGGMPPGVHQLLFANLTAHLAALYDEWGSILCVRTRPVRAGSQWSSSRQLEFPLAAAKPSSFFHFSFLSSQTAVSSFLFSASTRLERLSMFSHTLGLFVTSHSAFSISIFNTQHTLSSRLTYKICVKVQDGQKVVITRKTSREVRI